MIIEAKPEHAAVVCDVIIQSIQTLCIADHKNDLNILKSWLSNKTPDNCRLWIKSKHSKSFVTIYKETPVGIAIIGINGHIYLFYMHPNQIGQGKGKQLLLACENQALAWELKQITVDSSYTAKSFYESQGFKSNGEPFIEDNLCSYPLIKQLKS